MNESDPIWQEVKVLVIEDEQMLAWSIENDLKQKGCEVRKAHSLEEARREFILFRPDVAVCDLRLPDGDGMDLLKEWKLSDPSLPVILMTAHGGMDSAIHAIRLSAFDYIRKPFDLKDLVSAVRRAAEVASLRQKLSRMEGSPKGTEPVVIEGKSAVIKDLRSALARIAKSPTDTVLLYGETGVGKELAARALHEWSAHAQKPYIEINCASIPETLLESELFGFERGAFTDAKNRKLGLFEIAHGGTIFLDEIGEMPFKLQAKLLRALEHRRFKRLGGVKDIEFNARIVAATNRDLLQEIAEERFRADLYYRLSVVPLTIPPLRDRIEDIPVLTAHFLEQLAKKFALMQPQLDASALKRLGDYHWPGNVRELRNVLYRAMIMHAPSVLKAEQLQLESLKSRRMKGEDEPLPISARAFKEGEMSSRSAERLGGFDLPEEGISLDALEKHLLQQALTRARFNQKKAAELLGISRHTLRYRLEKHKLLEQQLE